AEISGRVTLFVTSASPCLAECAPGPHRSLQPCAWPRRPPLLVLHGLFGMARNWRSVAKSLARNHSPIICADLRNHGDSPHHQDMSMAAMVGDVRQFIEQQLDATPPQLVRVANCCGRLAAAQRSKPGWFRSIMELMLSLDLSRPPDPSLAGTKKAYSEFLAAEVPEKAIREFLLTNLMEEPDCPGKFRWRINLPALLTHIEELMGCETPAFSACSRRSEIVFVEGAGHWVHADRLLSSAQSDSISEKLRSDCGSAALKPGDAFSKPVLLLLLLGHRPDSLHEIPDWPTLPGGIHGGQAQDLAAPPALNFGFVTQHQWSLADEDTIYISRSDSIRSAAKLLLLLCAAASSALTSLSLGKPQLAGSNAGWHADGDDRRWSNSDSMRRQQRRRWKFCWNAAQPSAEQHVDNIMTHDWRRSSPPNGVYAAGKMREDDDGHPVEPVRTVGQHAVAGAARLNQRLARSGHARILAKRTGGHESISQLCRDELKANPDARQWVAENRQQEQAESPAGAGRVSRVCRSCRWLLASTRMTSVRSRPRSAAASPRCCRCVPAERLKV
uniref:sn-1-specific diacylglycerol lipase ABHD11 n=1 Tax=Macrostomum lignano TaxID=282301 RepID=A0A1I8JR15_9PLAT